MRQLSDTTAWNTNTKCNLINNQHRRHKGHVNLRWQVKDEAQLIYKLASHNYTNWDPTHHLHYRHYTPQLTTSTEDISTPSTSTHLQTYQDTCTLSTCTQSHRHMYPNTTKHSAKCECTHIYSTYVHAWMHTHSTTPDGLDEYNSKHISSQST